MSQVRALRLPPRALRLTTHLPSQQLRLSLPLEQPIWLQHAHHQEAGSALISQELLLPPWLRAPLSVVVAEPSVFL